MKRKELAAIKQRIMEAVKNNSEAMTLQDIFGSVMRQHEIALSHLLKEDKLHSLPEKKFELL